MKNALTTALLVLLFSAVSFAGKKPSASLSVQYEFKNIEPGYDHMTKAVLLIDDEEVYEGKEHLQSKPFKFSVGTTPGKHNVRLELWALYEGQWELHSIDNNYSVDCFVEDEFKIGKKSLLKVVFDLDDDTSFEFK